MAENLRYSFETRPNAEIDALRYITLHLEMNDLNQRATGLKKEYLQIKKTTPKEEQSQKTKEYKEKEEKLRKDIINKAYTLYGLSKGMDIEFIVRGKAGSRYEASQEHRRWRIAAQNYEAQQRRK